MGVSITGSSRAITGLKAVGIELRNHGSGPIDLLLIGKKERRGSYFECLHDLRGDAIQQLHHVAGFEEIPAEGVQLLDVPLSRGGFLRLLPRARCQVAADDSHSEKRDQRHPVLRIGNRKSANRRKEIVVESQSWRPTDIGMETAMPQNVETAKIASRSVSATVVALTGRTLW